LNRESYDELKTLNPSMVSFTWAKTGGVGFEFDIRHPLRHRWQSSQQNLLRLNGVEFTGAAENNMQPAALKPENCGAWMVPNIANVTAAPSSAIHPSQGTLRRDYQHLNLVTADLVIYSSD